VCLVGPSGCGKTTILNLVAGLERPDSGSVTCDGRPVEGPGRDRMVLFQESALFPWLDALGNVLFGLSLKPELDGQARRETAAFYLEMVGLTGFARACVHELSGGMKQRVALARALAPNPRVLLMDEPFAALDAQTKVEVRSVFLKIWEERRRSVVFVTHDLGEALLLGDRIVMLAPGGKEVVNLRVPFQHPRDVSELPFDKDFRELERELSQKLR
jgi:NitT/TauT family transport system ATP-binding protein